MLTCLWVCCNAENTSISNALEHAPSSFNDDIIIMICLQVVVLTNC